MYSCECGEIHITLDPNPSITYVSNSMLHLLNAGADDKEWFQALKSKPFFFLTEKDIPVFKECCSQAEAANSPVYFEHYMYDYNLRKIKMHGWISKKLASNEFMIVELADSNIAQRSKNLFFQAIEHIYDDAFEINTVNRSVRVLRNLNTIGYSGSKQLTLWDFKSFLLSRLIHPNDWNKYTSFLDSIDSSETQSGSVIECRLQDKFGNTRWIQITYFRQEVNEALLCFSDITNSKNVKHMQQQIRTDKTTKIMNRETFEKTCCSFHGNIPLENSYNILLLIEIDRFEEFSLDKQDELLIQTSDMLQSFLGNDAVYARFGDKKFIVCFHDLANKSAGKEKISALFKHLRNHSIGNSMPGLSFGFAQCMHDPTNKYRTAFECANEALKDAVKSGGNTIRDYDFLSSHSHITKLSHEVKIQTFGYFEVFVDGRPVLFKNKKAKELLAVLVDRRGGYLSSGDIISCLWENESVNQTTNARCRKVAMQLKNTLAEYDIEYIIETADRQRRLVADAVDCDLFHFLSGETAYINAYDGSYMLNYSWSEWTVSYLNNIKAPL